MAEDIPGLMSPSAITRVSRDMPRHDEPQRRQPRQGRRAPTVAQTTAPESHADPGETPVVGSRLNVRV